MFKSESGQFKNKSFKLWVGMSLVQWTKEFKLKIKDLSGLGWFRTRSSTAAATATGTSVCVMSSLFTFVACNDSAGTWVSSRSLIISSSSTNPLKGPRIRSKTGQSFLLIRCGKLPRTGQSNLKDFCKIVTLEGRFKIAQDIFSELKNKNKKY